MLRFLHKLKYFDIKLLLAIFLLSMGGLALLYSTSVSSELINVFWRQVIFMLIGWLIFFFFCFFDYHTLTRSHKWLYIITILALIYVLFFGEIIRGGKRWIDLGFFNFQPAEFVKFVLILGLARILYLQRGQINSIKNLIRSFFYVLIPAGLVLLEPDFGSAAVIIAIWLAMLLTSPIKKKFIAGLAILFIAFSALTWNYLLQDFQKNRIKVFLNPQLDLRGQGYNVKQAVIAIGSGGLWGKGLGKGPQSLNRFLPERQTDFIFAASAEQVGLIGSFVLLILFYILLKQLLIIMKNAKDDLGAYVAAGVFFLIFIHTLVNIGMNMGLLPVTGIPLPFMSAGGSFFITVMMALGLSQNVSLQSKVLRF